MMNRALKIAAAALMAAFVAACAQAVATQPSFEPPPRKQLDAKTQLETGRR